MTPVEQALLAALLAWRQALLEAGVPDTVLPLEADLELIATTPGVTRELLPSLPLQRPDSVAKYAPGVLSTLRRARVEVQAAPPEQPAAVPPPPAPSPVRRDEPAAPAQEAAPPQDLSTAREEARQRRQRRRSGLSGPSEPEDEQPLAQGGFAPYDLAGAGRDVPGRLGATLQPGGVRLAWEAATGGPTVLYRVVSRDDLDVWSPDEADPVVVTSQPDASDGRPFTAVARFYAVWSYTGTDDASARAAQPVLLARGAVIAPPSDVRLVEDHGLVIASWSAAPGTDRVDVQRLPVEQAHRVGYQPEFTVAQSAARTFQDRTCQPGQEYEYRLFAVRVDPHGGPEGWSDPVIARWRVTAVLTPVQDLQLTERQEGDRTYVDLSWEQPPLNEVVIYRTRTQPAAGATSEDLAVSALPNAGLLDDDRVPLDPQVVDGRGQLTGVVWPAGWSRVHFIPVSVSGGTARIGRMATRSRTSAIEDVRLVQRVRWQLLTFSWPEGAVSVSVYSSPVGTTLEDAPREPVAVLQETDYRRRGGTPLKLPPEGCALHLVPMSFFQGKKIPGRPTSYAYRGLYRLMYRINRPVPAAQGRRLRGAPAQAPLERTQVEVIGESSRPPDQQVLLTLVHHSTRLPLSVQDGEDVLLERRVPLPGGRQERQWTLLGELDEEGLPEGGYLRLFARSEGLELALLDPELESLQR